jgi:hypothetical protein
MKLSAQHRKKKIMSSQQHGVNTMALLLSYCKDINDWPEKWEIDAVDVAVGKMIVDEFKPFLIDRIKQGLSRKTIRNDACYLWVLGGEIIRQINENEEDRELSVRGLILKYVDDEGGPYWCHADDETEHRRYDAVCKRFFKYITKKLC